MDTYLGAIAQLGERLICIQEVVGSIPIGSTIYLVVIRIWRYASGWPFKQMGR